MDIDRLRKEIRVNERLNSATDKQSRLFTYDGVFDSSVGQCEVYDNVVAPLIDEVLSGYNCTVFAYGQTGTGKTYTMEGERSDFECSWQDDPKAGIVPRALDQLFETLNESSSTSQVAVSYMELYNEKLYDLLNPNDDFASLSIYEDKGGKVKIGRLAQVAVTKKDEIFEILQKGSAKRQKAATKLNSCSSRSHTIFTVTIRSKDPDALLSGEEIYRIGKLNLVDLAGSENIGRSGAVEKRAAEAGNINKSLLTLGRVITSLVERQNHIPYRESKLTRLLQDSLGGGTKTSIIATISPNILDVEDTLSTLDYAQRAKKIQNKPEVNQKVAKMDILRDVEEELLRTRRDLEAARCGTNAFVISKENYDSMTTTIDSLGKGLAEREAQKVELEIRICDLEAEKESINALFSETKQQLEVETKKRVETEHNLERTEKDLKVTTQDRNEQKHLVDVHVRTEQELKSQADQLLCVAQVSTDHVSKLHEKVERVYGLHEETISKVGNTCKSIEDQMKLFQMFVTENFDSGILRAVDSVVKNKFDQLSGSIVTASDQVDKFTDSVSVGIVSLTNSSDDQLAIDELNKVVISTQDLKKFKDELRTELSDALQLSKSRSQGLLQTFLDLFSRQRTALEELLMNLSQQLTQSSQDVAKEFASLESVIVNHLQNKSKEDELMAAEMQLTKKMIKDSSDLTTSKIAMIKEVLSELESDNSKATATVLDRMVIYPNELLKSSQNLQKVTSTICSAVSEGNKKVGKLYKASSSLVDQLDNTLSQEYQSNVDKVTSVTTHLNEQFDSVSSSADELHSKELEKLDSLLASGKSALSALNSAFESKTIALNELSNSVKEQAQPMRDQLQTVTQIAAESLETIDNEIYATKLHMESAQKTVSKEYGTLAEQIKSLELKKYQSTGDTPQKTNFSFPTNLTSTSPHERILQRYRQQDSSVLELAIVTELPEGSGLSSSSESIDSCGTSSSSSSNVENKIPNKAKNSSKIATFKKKEKSGKSEAGSVLKTKGLLQPTN